MATETAQNLSIRSTTKISPLDIVVVPGRNYSRYEDHPRESVERLAYKMSVEGNTNPLHVRRVPGDKNSVEVIAGHKRHAAGVLIIEGFDYVDSVTGDKVRVHNPDFKLQVINVNISDDEILDYNVSENAERSELSPMDWAKIVREYKTIKGLSTAQIASKLGKSVTQIDNWDSLNKLSDEDKTEVHSGKIASSVAVEMTKLSKEKIQEVKEKAKVTGKKPSLQAVKDARREQASEKGTGEKVARTMKQVKLFFEGERGPAEFTPIKKIAESVIAFTQGTVDDGKLKESLTEACEVSGLTVLKFLKNQYNGQLPEGVSLKKIVKMAIDSEISSRQSVD